MFILRKQKRKPLQLSVVVYSLLMLSVTILSCGNSAGKVTELHMKQHVDTLKIKSENIFRIYVSKITAANGNDSILLILDKSSSLLYKADTTNHIVAIDTLPRTVTADLKAVTYYKGGYWVQNEETFDFFSEGAFKTTPKTYTFINADKYAYLSTISEFKIDKEGSFLIYCIPKISNVIDAAGRNKYFSSKLVHKGIIEEGATLIKTNPLQEVTFPERYRKFYYNDMYPIFCSFGDSIVSTTQYSDSISLIVGGKNEFYTIPKEFSVIASAIPEAHVQSRTELDTYFAMHSSNVKLLKYKQKILLFQSIGANKYYDEQTGMLNDYLSLEKRIIVFDMVKKQFESIAYKLPANCVPGKSCIFNGKLVIISTDETRREISVLPTIL